jgi:phosphoglycolate phosphatase
MINEKTIDVISSFGHGIKNLFLYHGPAADKLAVVFPGANGYLNPVLHYTRKAALGAGYDVLTIEYGYYRMDTNYKSEFLPNILSESFEAVKKCMAKDYNKVLLAGKSLGSICVGETSRHLGHDNITKIFLTPIKYTIPYIQDGPCAVVYGTADPALKREDAERIKEITYADVLEIEGVGHSLEDDLDYIKAIHELERVIKHIVKYL